MNQQIVDTLENELFPGGREDSGLRGNEENAGQVSRDTDLSSDMESGRANPEVQRISTDDDQLDQDQTEEISLDEDDLDEEDEELDLDEDEELDEQGDATV